MTSITVSLCFALLSLWHTQQKKNEIELTIDKEKYIFFINGRISTFILFFFFLYQVMRLGIEFRVNINISANDIASCVKKYDTHKKNIHLFLLFKLNIKISSKEYWACCCIFFHSFIYFIIISFCVFSECSSDAP